MKAVLYRMAPGTPVIDLFADAPVGNPAAAVAFDCSGLYLETDF